MKDCGKIITEGINHSLAGREPWQIVTLTATSVLGVVWIWNFINQDESIYLRGKKQFFRIMKKIPMVQKKIDAEIGKIAQSFEDDIKKSCSTLNYSRNLPLKAWDSEKILKEVDEHLNLGHYKWRDGKVSGAVYYYNPELIKLITEVYGKASYTNPLHTDIFPGICKMEAEVIRMTCNMFNGSEDSCGSITTGGTESIMMAVKAFRDYATEKKGITRPNMVAPITAHTAFDKAAQYFKIHIKYIPVDPKTLEVNVKAMKKAIDGNTILLVGSAPNFPYGTMDDIEAIAALGVKYNIPVHVDACLGGFLTAFMEKAGYKIRPFDFRVPGVCSISADTHKYGFAPKGSSVVIYAKKLYRQFQYTCTTDWPGGVYGSPTVNGSRAGGIVAATWATMMNFGLDGYVEATKRIVDTARYIEKGLRNIKGIYVFGTPATSVVAIGSKTFDIFRLSDSLCKLGWNLNALQFPSGIHLCCTYMHTINGVADQFLNDVISCTAEIMKNPGEIVEGKMAIYGVAQSLPDRSLVSEFTKCFLDSMHYIPPIE